LSGFCGTFGTGGKLAWDARSAPVSAVYFGFSPPQAAKAIEIASVVTAADRPIGITRPP